MKGAALDNPIIALRDKTSHGGTVITCSPFSATHGKGWARVGDMASCPRCKGVFPIAQGDTSLTDDGKAVAYHGCKTACGATLIASQMFSFTEPSSGASAGAASSVALDALMQGFGYVGEGLASTYQDEPAGADSARYRGRFQLVDATTGEPVRSQAVRVRSTGGQYLTCI
ncbi:MAG: PAAR domain-containing protein [Proteobacteria bacterium]|nr:MAG: PAAR domain-containing protein [Pseudomonadota bacterium]